MSVRIRMKQMGRHSRHYFRIVAIDKRQQRDGRVIEELGTYDPFVENKDNRVTLKASRVKHWLSVGAQPSENVAVFIKKYLDKFEQIEAQGGESPAAEATSSEDASESSTDEAPTS